MDAVTIDTYNKAALEYDRETAEFWETFPPSALLAFTNQVKGRVLDVGSGPGRDGLLLKDKGLEVVCVDASPEMVKMSEARGLSSVQGDFLHLPFSEESFDGAWAYTALLHVPKAEAGLALSEVRRILKPEGIFFLGMQEGEGEAYTTSSGISLPRLFARYGKEELERLLAEHGFEVLYFDLHRPASKTYLHFVSRKI